MTTSEPQLVLLHGFAQTPASWDEVVELLPGDWQIHAPELPGHGKTALTKGEPSPGLVRTELIELIEPLQRPAVVWGYSQGSRPAFDLALARPDLVAALVIESGAPGIADPVARAERRSRDFAMSKRIEAEPIENFVALWEHVPALGEQSQDVIEKQRPMRLSNDPAGLAAALRGLGQASYEPMWDRLGQIEVPTLLLTGTGDPVYVAHAHEMAHRLPLAEHRSIPNAGHSAHISQPAVAAAAVREFVTAL